MIAVLKREFKSYFTNMSGYLFVAILLLFTGVFTTVVNLVEQYTEFEYALQSVVIIFLLIIPILTMKSVADDKHAKTDALLYSLPIKLSSIVIGKYLALLAVLLIPLFVMCLYPLLLCAFGNISLINAYTGILGLFLLGAALISVCMFMSSLTESQVIAAVSGIGVTLALYFMETFTTLMPTAPIISLLGLFVIEALLSWLIYYMSKNVIISVSFGIILGAFTLLGFFIDQTFFTGLLGKLLKTLAVFSRFNDFSIGIFDIGSVIYYLSFTIFFVFLTIQSLEKKRYA